MVVAILRVVVILDHDPRAGAGPLEDRRAARRREHRTGRVLVRGGHRDRLHGFRPELIDAQPLLVDRHRHGAQTGVDRRLRHTRPTGILGRHAPHSVSRQRAPDQTEAVPRAVRDHELLGRGLYAADPTQVGGQGGSQLKRAGRIGETELLVGRVPQHARERGHQRPSRDRPERGAERAQVVTDPVRPRRRRDGRARRGDGRGDPCAAAPRRAQIALGGELGIGIDNHSARNPEPDGQVAGRWQALVGGQASAAHGLAQRVLEAGAKGAPRSLREVDVQVHLAPDSRV